MSIAIRSQENILKKLSIEQLNPMQQEAQLVIKSNSNIILLSPTGTGKTLAFLLPIIEELDSDCSEVQVLVLVPSRELALQIEQVAREMGTGYKINAVYRYQRARTVFNPFQTVFEIVDIIGNSAGHCLLSHVAIGIIDIRNIIIILELVILVITPGASGTG